MRDVDLAGRDVAAPFEDDGPQSPFDQSQRREETRGPRANDDHLGGVRDVGIVEMHGLGLRLAVDIQFDREFDLGLPAAGVDRPPDHAGQGYIPLRDARLPRSERGVTFRIGGIARQQPQRDKSGHGCCVFLNIELFADRRFFPAEPVRAVAPPCGGSQLCCSRSAGYSSRRNAATAKQK